MPTILIIDDEDAIRLLLRKQLEHEGYHVLDTGEAGKCVEICRENNPDIVITDIVMPDKDGIETIIELKKYFPNMKIIAMSGGARVGSDYYLTMAKQVGAAEVLGKPFSMKDFMTTIQKALE